MRHPIIALLSVALLASVIIVPTLAVADGDIDCLPEQGRLAFEDKVFIDPGRAGGEPVAIVAQDGSISVSAHAGTTHYQPDVGATGGISDFAVGYFNQTLNWRSEDGGRSWKYVGLVGTNQGPHSLTSTGFSDPDYAIDQAGTIYNVEIDLANNAVFSSRDDGQSYLLAHPNVFPGDRPWVAANEADEVFLYVNLPRTLLRSRDGGITWSILPSPPINGKPVTDPLNPDDGLIGPTSNGIAISGDDGETWTTYNAGELRGASREITKSVAADAAGNVYFAGAFGYRNENDTTPDADVSFTYFNRATETFGKVDIDHPEGDALWPWIVAGDDGRVAFTWLQTLYEDGEYNPEAFYAYAAVTTNGVGADCDGDGEIDMAPHFDVVNASGTPIHEGKICTGTGCNLSNGGDRRIGDFHSLQFDHTGRVFIVSGDTTLRSATGGIKPVSNPVFIGAADGSPLLLEEPRELRPTRCVDPFGATPLCESGQ